MKWPFNLCYSVLVESAYVCGIDAEWAPGLPTATATLLQLAFTTSSQRQQGSYVFLLVRLLVTPHKHQHLTHTALFESTSMLCNYNAGPAGLATESCQGLSTIHVAQCRNP